MNILRNLTVFRKVCVYYNNLSSQCERTAKTNSELNCPIVANQQNDNHQQQKFINWSSRTTDIHSKCQLLSTLFYCEFANVLVDCIYCISSPGLIDPKPEK